MNDEKWEQLVENIRSKFEVLELRTEEVDTHDHTETHDTLVFNNQGLRFRLVRETKPLVLGKKEFYSHRPGDTARTEYQVSDTEVSHKLRVYKENDFGEWEEINSDSFSL